MEKCGCRPWTAPGNEFDHFHIGYCPLHAAAPELLDLARWVRDSFKADERPENVDALIARAESK